MDNESIVINVPYLFQKNKEKRQEYKQRPEVKARRREYDKKSGWVTLYWTIIT